MDIKCKHCGKPLNDGAKFCIYCGEKVEESENVEEKIVEEQTNEFENLIVLIGLILFFLPTFISIYFEIEFPPYFVSSTVLGLLLSMIMFIAGFIIYPKSKILKRAVITVISLVVFFYAVIYGAIFIIPHTIDFGGLLWVNFVASAVLN